jgi:hypothetical protein
MRWPRKMGRPKTERQASHAPFIVADIPQRGKLVHFTAVYRLLVRHVPLAKNHAHSEVRVWRNVDETLTLITDHRNDEFGDGDPDRNEPRGPSATLLNPDFHMQWRKRIALAAKMVLPPT